MSVWLHVAAGPYLLLLDSGRVLEVIHVPEGTPEEEGELHRVWRGGSVRVMEARHWLNLPQREPGSGCVNVVCRQEGERAVLLVCDRVLGLVQATEGAFSPAPPFGGRFARCFDRIFTGAGESFALRCRHPLPEFEQADAGDGQEEAGVPSPEACLS